MFHPSIKDKMTALESAKAALTAKLRDASDAASVLLHPGFADRYQAQVADLRAALRRDTTKAEATSIIRLADTLACQRRRQNRPHRSFGV
ncbi:hypothetical protein ACOI1H_26040 [Loktanella sp. DJP18]|uniref:hypothetical protein n=1 Tax=Loktanella sp. DJP18 TaxID=3409788 RepID=UPI003BB6281C